MFKLEISCDGSAFRDEEACKDVDPYARQVRQILKDVSEKLEEGYTSGNVHDVYGNNCGKWSYEED